MSGTISAYATRVLHKSALQRKENSFLLDLSLYLKGEEGGRHAFSELSRSYHYYHLWDRERRRDN